MKWALSVLAITIVAACPTPVFAAACDIAIAEEVKVAKVVDGATLDLADGRRVRLAAVETGETAANRLASLVAGETVALALTEPGTDRHGYVLAQVFKGDAWIQAALVGEGLSRVATNPDTRRCAAALLELETAARAAKRGLWADPRYRVRKADELGGDIGTFQIVEGKVLAVKSGRERTYLNFGADYRTDFTVTLGARDRKRMAKDGIDPATWAGKTVRVRGWISLLNGPEIELTHPEQIQILE